MAAIFTLSILLITSQASEIACNAITKGQYYGYYGHADVHNSYDFTVLSATNDSWIVFQACSIDKANWCQHMNLYKLFENQNNWVLVTEYTDNNNHNDCGTFTVNNIASGQYRLTSASCIVSNYSLFMGCSNDITVSDTNDYIPYTISDIDTFESEISCDIIVSGTLSQSYESTKYYKFDVLEPMKWISFDTCTDTKFQVHRLVIYMFDGRMKLMQTDGYYANCLKLNVSNIRAGIYYMSIESKNEGQYTLNMECSNNHNVEIADNYNEFSHIPSKHHNISYLHVVAILFIVIIVPIVGFSIFWKIWNKKIRKEAKDINYIQTSQNAVNNDTEEVIKDDVPCSTQKKYEDHIQLTDNKELLELE